MLSRFETLWPDSAAENAAHRRWAAEHPKRALAAAAAVGTIDQALLSGLPVRHAHLRGAALLRALVVVDEVHASDAYMTELLAGVLRRHVHAGGHALLLSATLGSEARDRLLMQQRRRLRPNEKRVDRGTNDAARSPYPALSDAGNIRPVPGTSTEKTVRVSVDPGIDDDARIAAEAAAAARAGAKVLVIRNDVKGAIAIHRALEGELGERHPLLFRAGGVPAPHHGRFAAPDRRVLDEAIEQSFGKLADRDAGVVLAGTQTLEQSLDIDADFLVMDLAPFDVLLQRLGRLHRHRRTDRAASFEAPVAVVLTPASRDLAIYLTRERGLRRHGIGGVYENVLSIEATWRALETRSTVTIPADNRSLVEGTTCFSRLASLAQALGECWEAHWREYAGSGQRAARRRRHGTPGLVGAVGQTALARRPGRAGTYPSRARRPTGGSLRDMDQSLRPSHRTGKDPGMDGEESRGSGVECDNHLQVRHGAAFSLGRLFLRLQSVWPGLGGRRWERTLVPCPRSGKGSKMSYQDRITIEPGKRGGKPCIRGMRITVYDVLEYLASGMSEQEILNDFPDLTLSDVRACLRFAADRERKLVSLGES